MKTRRIQPNNGASVEPDYSGDLASTPSDTPDFTLGKILVPLDFSDCSHKAIQYAIPFASHFKAEIVFLHVVRPFCVIGTAFRPLDQEPMSEGALLQSAKMQLAAIVQGKVSKEIHASIEVRRGAPSLEIVNFAKDIKADLIVMSTHGHTGRVHALIGSVAGDVTRLAPCPVLVVRENEQEFVRCKSDPFKAGQIAVSPAQVL